MSITRPLSCDLACLALLCLFVAIPFFLTAKEKNDHGGTETLRRLTLPMITLRVYL